MSNHTDTTADRPELWVPDALAGIFPDVLASIRETVSPLAPENRDWPDEVRGWLRGHVRAALSNTKHGGIVPGAIMRPPLGTVLAPVQLSDGEESTFLRQWERETDETMTPEKKEEWAAYRYSEQHRETFADEVDDVVDQVLSSNERTWEAYLHKLALDESARRRKQARDAEQRERQRLALHQCPVCGADDPRKVGPIEHRPLLGWAPYGVEVDKLRSCLACWHVASAAHFARLSAETTTTGQTRSALVHAVLGLADDEAAPATRKSRRGLAAALLG